MLLPRLELILVFLYLISLILLDVAIRQSWFLLWLRHKVGGHVYGHFSMRRIVVSQVCVTIGSKYYR